MHRRPPDSACRLAATTKRRVGFTVVAGFVGLLVIVTVGGCQARRAGVPRDSLDAATTAAGSDEAPPTAADVLRLRVPAPAAAPTAIDGPPAVVAFARGEDPASVASAPVDADDAALRCLHASLVRDYGRVADACLAFAERWPLDPRAAVALHIATSHRSSLSETARRALLAGLLRVVPACAAARSSNTDDVRASCAVLAVVVDDAARGVAASLGDRAALEALRPGGDFTQGTAEGPFLDADEAFDGSPFSMRPLVKHGRFRVFDVEDDTGVLSPSRRGLDGWWRIALRGETTGERTGVIALRTGSAVELRVDGVPVVVRRPGDVGATVELVGVKLGAGVHAVEVLGYESGRGVRISAFDDDGRPLLQPVPRQRWARTANASVVALPGLASTPPSTSVPPARGDATALAGVMFRHAQARAGVGASVDDERVLARQLLEWFGWSTPALAAAAQTIEDDALPDRVAVALAAPLWARVLQQWPTNPVALLSVARSAAEDRPDEALARYRAVVASRPDYPIGRRELIDALLERGIVDEARKNAGALLVLGETNENIDATRQALRSTGDVSRAARLGALRARRTTDDDDGRALLAQGDTAGARRVLARRVDDGDERALGPWLDLVELDDPAAALRAVEAFATRFPDDVELQLRRARLAALIGGAGAGLAVLDGLDTTDVRALRLRAAWGGARAFGDRPARGDEVIAARRAATSQPFPGFPTVFLVDDFERRYAVDGTSVAVRHWIAELRTKDALDAFGEIRLDDDEVLARLRVVKADGTIVEHERHAGVDDVSLPGLAPGDIVELISFSADTSARDGAAWETRSLVRAAPAVHRSYVVEVPAELARQRSVRVLVENGASPPSTITVGPPGHERTRYAFSSDSAPPLLDEPGAVDRLESEPQGGLTIDVDDDVFRRRRAQPFFRNARVDPWLKDVAAVVAGRGTETERLQRIFRFVARSVVAADSPADAVSVLAVGRGQRQPLFFALARAAGIDAHALGVHAVLDPDRRIPHARSFATVVNRVVTDGEPHIVAFLDEAAVWDGLAPWFTDAETIDLADGARGRLDDRHVSREIPEVTVDLAVVDDAAGRRLGGTVALRMPPWLAGYVRSSLQKLTEPRLAQLLEAALGGTLPGLKVTRVATPGLDVEVRPLALVADVELPVTSATVRLDHLFPAGALAAFNLAPPLGSFATVAERRRDLAVPPGAENLVVRLRVPERTAFVDVPPDVALEAGPFSLRQRTSVNDDGLTFERRLDRRASRIAPTTWPAVRAALGPLLAQADAHLGFVLAAQR